jgi:hypothetical protein
MKSIPTVALCLSVALVAGCYAQAARGDLVNRAAFDLGCESSKLRYTPINSHTQGVVGCGKRATYVESCDGQRTHLGTTCTWVLNGTIADSSPTASTSGSDDYAPPPPPR